MTVATTPRLLACLVFLGFALALSTGCSGAPETDDPEPVEAPADQQDDPRLHDGWQDQPEGSDAHWDEPPPAVESLEE